MIQRTSIWYDKEDLRTHEMYLRIQFSFFTMYLEVILRSLTCGNVYDSYESNLMLWSCVFSHLHMLLGLWPFIKLLPSVLNGWGSRLSQSMREQVLALLPTHLLPNVYSGKGADDGLDPRLLVLAWHNCTGGRQVSNKSAEGRSLPLSLPAFQKAKLLKYIIDTSSDFLDRVQK